MSFHALIIYTRSRRNQVYLLFFKHLFKFTLMTHKKERQRAHRLQFPCFACGYGCDNAPQIINHFLKRHNFDLSSYAIYETSPEDLGPQLGCPLCVYWCVGEPDMLLNHYEEQHELYLIVDGDDIKQDPKADEKRRQKHKKIELEEKGKASVEQEVPAAEKGEGSQETSKQKSDEKPKEPALPAEEQKHSLIMQKLMELMDLVKKHERSV
jgi:hypothetical protein